MNQRERERERESERTVFLAATMVAEEEMQKETLLGNKERVAEKRSTGLVGFYTCEDGNMNPNLQFCLLFF